ncbi:MAG: hypothetical protein IPL53_21700 [Ignavibacteria bacterium]|nr:hypothetical protein [Ignavibacteria bacterium]
MSESVSDKSTDEILNTGIIEVNEKENIRSVNDRETDTMEIKETAEDSTGGEIESEGTDDPVENAVDAGTEEETEKRICLILTGPKL